MRLNAGEKLDHMLNAAHEKVQESIKEVNVFMDNNESIEYTDDGGTTIRQNGRYRIALTTLEGFLDEIHELKIGYNSKIKYLTDDGLKRKISEILTDAKLKHIDYIDKANLIVQNLK